MSAVGFLRITHSESDQEVEIAYGHSDCVEGRTIALLGQLMLQRMCVFQFGKVLFLMRPASTNKLMNPTEVGKGCIKFANHHIGDYDEFHDLHDIFIDLYDEDGDMPEEED